MVMSPRGTISPHEWIQVKFTREYIFFNSHWDPPKNTFFSPPGFQILFSNRISGKTPSNTGHQGMSKTHGFQITFAHKFSFLIRASTNFDSAPITYHVMLTTHTDQRDDRGSEWIVGQLSKTLSFTFLSFTVFFSLARPSLTSLTSCTHNHSL